MGVPRFFRWVTNRYPIILSDNLSNNDDLEFDNLYLDMNGIIHSCSHNNDNNNVINPISFSNIVEAICNYINELVLHIVKPKQLLYIAIDGVAPRAKLNQQRSRRFRTANDRSILINKLINKSNNPSISTVDNIFDSNCITPGTVFMNQLSKYMKEFLIHQMKTNEKYKHLTIYFSGSEVPGEGEHKIISFIRENRLKSNYLPNQRHIMNGQDADMIMLALATHEPYFYILREKVEFKNNRSTNKSNRKSNGRSSKSKNKSDNSKEEFVDTTNDNAIECNNHVYIPLLDLTNHKAVAYINPKFQYLKINLLRECLLDELTNELLDSTNVNIERLIDDFVFLTFLIGNDFLPHIPSLLIGDGAFDAMFMVYKDLLNESIDYITYEGIVIDYNRFEQFLFLLSLNESTNVSASSNSNSNNNISLIDHNNEYRNQYYLKKFSVDIKSPKGLNSLNQIIKSYLTGLIWNLSYYSLGCVSWKWFYPYHYAPLLSDMKNLLVISESIDLLVIINNYLSNDINSNMDEPFTPYQQLLSCLPQSSKHLLPQIYQRVMSDVNSPIYQYYPLSYDIDMDNKSKAWEGIVILPFIDEVILLDTERHYCPIQCLTNEEIERNRFGMIHRYTTNSIIIDTLSDNCKSHSNEGYKVIVYEESFQPRTAFSKPFRSILIEGTKSNLPGFMTLEMIYQSNRIISNQSMAFPNNCSLWLRFDPIYESILVALSMNIANRCKYFKPNIKAFHINICKNINLVNPDINVDDMYQNILPMISQLLSPVSIRVQSSLYVAVNKSIVTLAIDDTNDQLSRINQYIKQLISNDDDIEISNDIIGVTIGSILIPKVKKIKNKNRGKFSDSSSKYGLYSCLDDMIENEDVISDLLPPLDNDFHDIAIDKCLVSNDIPNDGTIQPTNNKYKENKKIKPIDNNNNELIVNINEVLTDIQSIITDEFSNFSIENGLYIDLLCDTLEISDELINYPKIPFKLLGNLQIENVIGCLPKFV